MSCPTFCPQGGTHSPWALTGLQCTPGCGGPTSLRANRILPHGMRDTHTETSRGLVGRHLPKSVMQCERTASPHFPNQHLSSSPASPWLKPSGSQRARKPSHTLHKDQPPGARAGGREGPGDKVRPVTCSSITCSSHSFQLNWAFLRSDHPVHPPPPGGPPSCVHVCFSSPHFHKWTIYEAHLMSTSPRSHLSVLWILQVPLLKISIITYEHVLYLQVYLLADMNICVHLFTCLL